MGYGVQELSASYGSRTAIRRLIIIIMEVSPAASAMDDDVFEIRDASGTPGSAASSGRDCA